MPLWMNDVNDENLEFFKAQWLEHVTSIMEVKDLIPTWNSDILSVVLLPVAKKMSFAAICFGIHLYFTLEQD